MKLRTILNEKTFSGSASKKGELADDPVIESV